MDCKFWRGCIVANLHSLLFFLLHITVRTWTGQKNGIFLLTPHHAGIDSFLSNLFPLEFGKQETDQLRSPPPLLNSVV
ncbi:hypothetical protein XELAEV_18025569mg [Xenopus laevis]|uniref:Uncharacterized protein n=1 Tax=Xenopus laevis TaxID=8355 RepID=A0A974CZY6_XENLA|nr:hypothetical protein XELAEV_18025569mg [Xenopus laevis]